MLVFGNIFHNLKTAEQCLILAQQRFDDENSDEAREGLFKAKADLRRLLNLEEPFWKLKARIKWLQEGDRNTKSFHAVVAERRRQMVIHKLKNSQGHWIDHEDAIADEAAHFFSNLLSDDSSGSSDDLLKFIPNLISSEENSFLEAVPTMEELRQVVFAMDGDSAPGPDGFTGKFFTASWEVIASDLYETVVSFFCGSELPKWCTATSLLL